MSWPERTMEGLSGALAAQGLSRRAMLTRAANGFGMLAFSALFGQQATAASAGPASAIDAATRPSHTRPRAKHVIFLFMEGAVSQVDSFDYKPSLRKYHGQDPRQAIGRIEKTQFEQIGTVLQSPWNFQQRGQSGLWISDLFPHVAQQADKLCVIRSMTSNFPEHTSANYFLHSGSGLQGRPSMGAWVTYALGSGNRNLPGFVVLNGGQIPSGGLDNFNNGFLPATFQGSLLNARGTPLANVTPREPSPSVQASKRRLAARLNSHVLQQSGGVDALESAIANQELAARMQLAIPDLMDVSDESEATWRLYGLDSPYEHTRTYALQCLLARRMVERDVRFIELTIPMVDGYSRWDAHGGLVSNHGNNARAVDQPIAGLLVDLEQRGKLEDTLVVWAGEFGRTPFAQGSDGRDHNEFGFSVWLAGGGVKAGFAHGETDEWGYKSVVNPVTMHDLHATILHLLGLDHERLTFRFSGRDMRLTDVHGNVVREVLA
jgi:hypothetical protein